jgi:hypothetical protein
MNSREVFALLTYCTELDGRHSPNELKVAAWLDVFNAEAADMTADFARTVARKHYARQDTMLTPATFVREWKQAQGSKALGGLMHDSQDRHCRRANCRCTHEAPCYRGWHDREDNASTAPCPVCRAELAHLVAMIPPPGRRVPGDWARVDE